MSGGWGRGTEAKGKRVSQVDSQLSLEPDDVGLDPRTQEIMT